MIKKIKNITVGLIIAALLCGPFLSFSRAAEPDNLEVKDLNKQIQDKQDSIKKIQDQQKIYSQAIAAKQKEKASLANQLSILDSQLAKAALDIESAQTEIDRTNLEISKVNLEIKDKNAQIENQKEHIASIIRLMQRQNDKSGLEILLLNGTLNDFVSQVKYLEDINKRIGQSLAELKQYKQDLEGRQKDLSGKQRELNGLKAGLEDKKFSLASDQENKTALLDQTKSSEKQYQRLLDQARREQMQAQSDIVALEKTIRAKMQKISGEKLEFNDSGFIWPVIKNRIMAYFHDPEYPFRYIFEHPAIDIRAAQSSPLRAAASGYVAIAKNAGKGYSYIMIVHGNGLATVYGHVSKIYVSPDEYVVQGQVIGLSGGMPGTSGAGPLTTGPHLHFEIRLNGVPVDPLEYLP